MLNISSVLFKENINLSLKASCKDGAISEMVNMLYQNKYISDKEQFQKEIYKREAEGITGVGDGIAIPHGRNSCVKKSVIAIGRTKDDLNWETFDDKPVHCIIMFAIRDLDMSQHIMLLSQVAQLLLDKQVISVLTNTNDPEEIIRVFEKEETK